MKQELEINLAEAVRGLSPEKVRQVIDFADYLRTKYTTTTLQRGSAEAILQALEQTGPLEFEPGELEKLLDEIQAMREMDIEADDRLFA